MVRKEDVAWIPDSLQALEILGQDGFEFIVLSNQAGIGRGVVERQVIDDLHAWMIGELGRRGIVLRDILICPHNWDDGCSCRKPSPGLFFQASCKYSLRLDRTVYVGDDIRDAQAANRAGCPCLLLGEPEALNRPGEVGVLDPATSYEVPVQQAASLLAGLPWIRGFFASWEMPTGKEEMYA